MPSIYRLYSLAVIYRRELRELLNWYGVALNWLADDLQLAQLPKTHGVVPLDTATAVNMPVRLNSAFDPRDTMNLGRMIEQWGLVPLAFLGQFDNPNYTYAYIGTEDLMMQPLLPPGSFVLVDESRNRISEGKWHSEYERPIYFVETRHGYKCCWCSIGDGHITLQPHPLSPEPVRILRHPQEAEILGQVVGVAMRRHDPQSCEQSARSSTKLYGALEKLG